LAYLRCGSDSARRRLQAPGSQQQSARFTSSQASVSFSKPPDGQRDHGGAGLGPSSHPSKLPTSAPAPTSSDPSWSGISQEEHVQPRCDCPFDLLELPGQTNGSAGKIVGTGDHARRAKSQSFREANVPTAGQSSWPPTQQSSVVEHTILTLPRWQTRESEPSSGS